MRIGRRNWKGVKIAMTDNVKELLPIGSVIRLRGAKRYMMIYGICQTERSTQKEYDYIGVIWPEGNIGAKTHVLFQHADVEEILFTGLDNAERRSFLEKLDRYYENRK